MSLEPRLPVHLSISSFRGSRSHSLPSLPALSICCLYSYRNQKHTVNSVCDAIALCILTVRFTHSDEIREKQMSQLSGVYSTETTVQRKALHGDVHTRQRHFFFDRHLFLLRDKCQVVARLLDMGDLMCTWQTYIWEAPCPYQGKSPLSSFSNALQISFDIATDLEPMQSLVCPQDPQSVNLPSDENRMHIINLASSNLIRQHFT